jgi:hypothetical protein
MTQSRYSQFWSFHTTAMQTVDVSKKRQCRYRIAQATHAQTYAVPSFHVDGAVRRIATELLEICFSCYCVAAGIASTLTGRAARKLLCQLMPQPCTPPAGVARLCGGLRRVGRGKARQPSAAPSLWRRGPVVSQRAGPLQNPDGSRKAYLESGLWLLQRRLSPLSQRLSAAQIMDQIRSEIRV